MYRDVDVLSTFDIGERLKLVETVVQKGTKGKKKDFKDVNKVNMLFSDFFDGAGHIVLDVDKGFKVAADIVLFLTLQLSMSII